MSQYLLADPTPTGRKLLSPCSHQKMNKIYSAHNFPYVRLSDLSSEQSLFRGYFWLVCQTCSMLVYEVFIR